MSFRKDLEKHINKYDWNKIYKENFALRLFNDKNFKEKDLADLIYNKLKNPKVNLKNPKTEIHIIKKSSKYFVGKLLYQNKEPFKDRRPHLRPELHPSSLNPRLARALINLTGIKKGKIYDPFCGSGGILIEAGLLNLKPIGYDIDQIMLNRAQINLKHFKIKDYKLEKKDATTIKENINYLVTDLPYGLNTTSKNLNTLYSNFLTNLKQILKKQAVIVFPHFINHKKIINQAQLNILGEYDYYIHKSLSKKIVVVGS